MIIFNALSQFFKHDIKTLNKHDEEESEPFQMPINDSLDLHTFQPKEVKGLLEEYLMECHRKGFHEVRIIHGKGTGTLREIVHSVLKQSPLVCSFQLAPPEAGSWGATMVKLIGQ